MAGGLLPYFRHHWDADGNAASSLHWPLWPEGVDSFWLYWSLALVAVYVLRWHDGGVPPTSPEDFGLYDRLLYRWPGVAVVEAAAYVALRAVDLEWLRAPYLYVKIQVFSFAIFLLVDVLGYMGKANIQFFSYLAAALVWLDKVLIYTFPKTVLAVSGVLRDEGAAGLLYRAASVFSTANATANGS
ncbi:hypothetical protein ONZ43_g7052 [Nemania bipapillata]|uniref:Uncharacterized protein n=1 Tax=Nemania bipapillata TaxID=110536 RepID=A0ACC2HTP8_9PEZI|nr:hypothetical protein ONZ43_g7052 [Nemania bipapillata]